MFLYLIEVVLEIAAVNYTVSEGDSFVELGVVKLGFSDEDVLFNIVIEQGTARGKHFCLCICVCLCNGFAVEEALPYTDTCTMGQV